MHFCSGPLISNRQSLTSNNGKNKNEIKRTTYIFQERKEKDYSRAKLDEPRQSGYVLVMINLSLWIKSVEVFYLLQVRSVEAKEALRLQKENNFVILDVRPEAEFKEVSLFVVFK